MTVAVTVFSMSEKKGIFSGSMGVLQLVKYGMILPCKPAQLGAWKTSMLALCAAKMTVQM